MSLELPDEPDAPSAGPDNSKSLKAFVEELERMGFDRGAARGGAGGGGGKEGARGGDQGASLQPSSGSDLIKSGTLPDIDITDSSSGTSTDTSTSSNIVLE